MQRIYLDYKGNLRAGNIDLFLQISIDLYLEYNEISKKITGLENDKEENTKSIPDVAKYFDDQERIIHEIFHLKNKRYKIAIQGLITLATYFESLINEIGIIELGSKYYKENLDKLSVQAKWEVVLKLIYSKSISKDSMQYEALNDVIAARNKIVHYKTKSIKPTKKDVDSEVEFAKRMNQVFDTAIKNLKGFHNNLMEIDKERNLLESLNFQIELKRI